MAHLCPTQVNFIANMGNMYEPIYMVEGNMVGQPPGHLFGHDLQADTVMQASKDHNAYGVIGRIQERAREMQPRFRTETYSFAGPAKARAHLLVAPS